MLRITDTISISDRDIQIDYIRACGPGGQNVNKLATAAQLRFDVANCPSLTDQVRTRLSKLAGRRLTDAGVLIITARRYRTQRRNRQDAIERLTRLIRQAACPPTPRKKTKPTTAAKHRRLEAKQHRSKTKHARRHVQASDE